MPFAEIVFNLPLDHSYTYRIPEDFNNLQPGMRVLVPFGKRTITGIAVSVIEKSTLTSTKNITDLLDEKPLISPQMLELTKWVSDYYMSSWGQAIYLALPKGIDSQIKERIHILLEDPHINLTERQKELYLIIGEQSGNTKEFYRKKFGNNSFHHVVSVLEKKGLIQIEKYLENARVRKLTRKFVTINLDYGNLKGGQELFLKYISRRPEIDEFLTEMQGRQILLADFLRQTGMATQTLQKIIGYGLCSITEEQIERKPDINFSEEKKTIKLNAEQIKAIKAVSASVKAGQFSTFLLHGVTGSGKTQVYIEVLKKVLQTGKSAVILIPEIALTPQTVSRFSAVAEDKIAVFHSKMSAGERFDAWMSCYEEKVKIVVGPRSALFSPLKNIGLIVVDEEHETTYKQSDTVPHYHARDVAVFWAKMNQAAIILGSATPSLESYYNARLEKYQLLEIKNRVVNIRLPDVQVVDMKKHRAHIGRDVTLFSQVLIDKIDERLAKKEQVIILQNRRGYSSFMQCKECGFIPLCPGCDISLTYHSFSEQLRCHICGHKQAAYQDCPACGGKQIAYKGVGTQRIQGELAKFFPDARILRMDQDTTRGKNRHDAILQSFGAGEADILLGTQMIAKGLDFENVTLVGVVSADVGLAIPDFRAAERVFQLLTQVAGRSGRGQKAGEVVVQSFLFGHFSIQFAQAHDFIGFYMQEMQHRRDFKYPPFYKMIQVMVSANKMSNAISLVRSLSVSLNRRAKSYCQVVGPAPALIPRVNNFFRWQFLVRLNLATDPNGQRTRAVLKQILEPHLKARNQDLRVTVDVDPLVLS